jgi:hypothetical protein
MNFPALLLFAGLQALASDRVGDIEFFGYKGLDIAVLRKALPVHEGDEYSSRTQELVRQAIGASLGSEPTDVAAICCDGARKPTAFHRHSGQIVQELRV